MATSISSACQILSNSPKFVSFDGLRSSSSLSNFSAKSSVFAPAPRCNVSSLCVRMSAVTLPVRTFEGGKSGEVALDLKTAREETAKAVVHRGVITYLQNGRRGTASTLTRSEVRGGGRKPYKQKGTGRARIGSLRTPLRPGGGVVFGPKPVDWTIKINKKEKRLAVSTAIQSAASSMIVIEDLDDKFDKPKTKEFVQALARWGVDFKRDHTLLIATEVAENVRLSSRNIERLKVVTPGQINIYDVLRADKVLVTVSGVEYLNKRYGKGYFLEGSSEGQEFVISIAEDGTVSVSSEAAEGSEEEASEVVDVEVEE